MLENSDKWQEKNMARDRKTMASARESFLNMVIGKWHENMASDRKTMARGTKTVTSGRKKIWQVTGKQWQVPGKVFCTW